MYSNENESLEADNDYLETMKQRMRGNLPQKVSSGSGLAIKKNLTQAGIENAAGFEDSAQAIMDSAQRRQGSISSSGVRSPEVKSQSSQGVKKHQNSNSASYSLRAARRHELAAQSKSSADLPNLYATAAELRAEAERLERQM